MRRVLVPLFLLSVFLCLPRITLCAPEWFDIFSEVSLSTARMTTDLPPQPNSDDPTEGTIPGKMGEICTAFSINEDKGFYLSAYHCVGENMTLGGERIQGVMFGDEVADIVVLISKQHRPALHPAKQAYFGEDIGALGFGYGQGMPIVRRGHVSNPDMYIKEKGGPYFFVDTPYVGGMSGSAVVNAQGKVVSIVQMSDDTTGMGLGIHAVLDLTRSYWQFSN